MAKKTLYMKITLDKYSLIEFVTDDIKELAEKYHTTPNAIRSNICHAKQRGTRCSFASVEIED